MDVLSILGTEERWTVDNMRHARLPDKKQAVAIIDRLCGEVTRLRRLEKAVRDDALLRRFYSERDYEYSPLDYRAALLAAMEEA